MRPEVTARALWLYDRDLCPQLIEALQKHMGSEEEAERRIEEQEAVELNKDHGTTGKSAVSLSFTTRRADGHLERSTPAGTKARSCFDLGD